MPLEIFFEVVDQIHGLFKQLFICTTIHQLGLGAKHLRNLGQNSSPSFRNQQVGKGTDCRIGCNTGQTIRAAAFHADDQLAAADRFAVKKLPAYSASSDKKCLSITRSHYRTLDRREILHDLDHIPQYILFNMSILLFSQPDQDKYSACIRMIDQIGKNLPGVFWSSPSGNIHTDVEKRHCFNRTLDKILCFVFYRGGNIIYTSYSRDDPKFVANPTFPSARRKPWKNAFFGRDECLYPVCYKYTSINLPVRCGYSGYGSNCP